MQISSILIAGAGSIGSMLGLLLKQNGYDVTLYRRNIQNHIEDINVVGIENFSVEIEITSAKTFPQDKIFDIVIIAVQRQQLIRLLEELKRVLTYSLNTIFICLQNGLNASAELCRLLDIDKLKVLQASIWWSATMISADQILYHNKAPTYLGIPKIECNVISEQELNDISMLFASILETIVVEDIENETQKKLILNIVSPVFAMFKQPYPTGINNLKIRRIVHLLYDEVLNIADSLNWSIADPKLENFHRLLNSVDRVDHYSMRADLPTHKVSTQISVEKYGGKGSNVTALLSFFIENGAELCETIHKEVMKLPPNYNTIDVESIYQKLIKKKKIECVLNR